MGRLLAGPCSTSRSWRAASDARPDSRTRLLAPCSASGPGAPGGAVSASDTDCLPAGWGGLRPRARDPGALVGPRSGLTALLLLLSGQEIRGPSRRAQNKRAASRILEPRCWCSPAARADGRGGEHRVGAPAGLQASSCGPGARRPCSCRAWFGAGGAAGALALGRSPRPPKSQEDRHWTRKPGSFIGRRERPGTCSREPRVQANQGMTCHFFPKR